MSPGFRRTALAAIKVLIALAALGYMGTLALMYVNQERLIFPGTPLPADYRFRFDPGQRFEEIRVPVPGATLDALHFMQDKPRGLVFYVHGNGGNLATWTRGIDFYRRINYDLFIFDFRGYGKSTGRIESEKQLDADVRAAWDAIAPRYRDLPIIIQGRSLGTGLAARLARDVVPRLLVLVSPYTSLAAIGKLEYPFVPEWLNRYPMRTDALIGDIKSPIVLIHGTADAVIPFTESERLKKLARAPIELLAIAGAGHTDRSAAYLDALAKRLIAAAGG
ncbi:MAG TPA: alpha/beta fold hydrolase [Casimicrobiaceae bacterium]